MKKLSFLIAALAMAGALYAQTPVNDDCSGLIDLGPAPICDPTVYNNVGATPTDIGNDNFPSCFNNGIAHRDVWFMFTCPDTLFDFRITLTGVGNSILNPEFAVYRGDCLFDGLAELLCAKAEIGENSLFLDVTGLTPGLPYFIRVSDYSATGTPNSGEFTLCIDKIPPIVTIDEGSSSLCEGTLYDSGGPNGDYEPNEDYTFVICPNQPSACITFTLDYFNIEDGGGFGGGDVLAFFDGNNTNIPPITIINGANFTEPWGGGGVCFQVQATSGCLTVQFTSDGANEFEGWQGQWECSSQPCAIPEEIAIDTNITANDIVDAISTPLTQVTVTNIDCAPQAHGVFNFPTDDNNLGMTKGLILTSGSATNAIGPNVYTGVGTQLPPFAFDNPPDMGDADLDYLSQQSGNGSLSRDACIVEVDVFANTDELVFEYIFASEEYPEWVNSSFNDIFAFLISGPGIAGDPGLSNNAKNIAVLPFTTTPVQINSVNNNVNWQYYRNNMGTQTLSQVIEYDGLTSDSLGIKKSLTARSKVIPCNTYHLKFAISDRGDEALDSGVFISDIKAGAPDMTVQFGGGIDYITESCLAGVPNQVFISIPKPLAEASSYNVVIGGTATQGIDYTTNIPAVITFLPGQTQLPFTITPISDVFSEGTETITIQLNNDYGCGTVVLKTLVIELKDKAEVNVLGGDTLFVCAGGTLQLQAKGTEDYFWSPPGAVSNPFIANPTITPTQDIWLQVTGTLGVCTDLDSAFVKIIAPQIDVLALGNSNVCAGTPVLLQAVNNVNNTGLVWTPAVGLDDQYSPTPTATPSKTTTYTATITIAGCSVSDQIVVNIDTLFFPVLAKDTTVCQNYPVQLGEVLNTTTNYDWTPNTNLSDPNSSGPLATPDATTTYTLTATSANGYCTQTEMVTVTVIPANVDISGNNYRELCLGDTVALTALSNPPGAQVQWSPPFYLSSTTGPNTVATPDESVTIFATYNINGCLVRDSVRLRVDSLPDQTIIRVEDKSIYCPGDTVYLISPTYEPANFPDIKIEWLPFAGQETPLDLWNLVITATTTHTFERIVTNRGCKDTSSVEVPVGVPPTLNIAAVPPEICPGETSQITVTFDPPNTKLEWQDMPSTLSCTDCPNPVASPFVTTTYTLSTPEADCPSSASVTVNVFPPPVLNLAVNPVICLGGPGVQLNSTAEPGVTYTWTPPAGLDNPFSATPIATPTETTVYSILAESQFCSSQGSVTVTVASVSIDAGADQTVCFGEDATLTATVVGFQPDSIVWQPGGKKGLTIIESPVVPVTYTATAYFGDSCSVSDAVFVDVVSGVVLSSISGAPDPADSICVGSPITLKVTVTPPDAGLVWLQNGIALSGISGDSVTFIPQVPEGSAEFSVVATNSGGCTAESSITYNFRRCLAVPNAFTPNGDEVNDTFGPILFGSNTEVTTFYIFNRWGAKVFEASPAKPRWDGTHDGEEAPSDVYAYYIVLRYANGEQETLKGDVALLR